MSKLLCVELILLAGALTACASQPLPEASSLQEPVIRAESLTVAARTTIELVSGTAYITRDGEALELAAQVIAQGDLLQINDNSAVRLRSPDGKERVLGRKQGEWFQFSVRDN